jgi:hypothetical protein
MPKKLTPKLKRMYFDVIKKRDGDVCFFDKMPFVQEVLKWKRTWHHLNKNTEDNRPENLVFAHEECNRQCENKPDWQILSKEKLLDNEKYHQYAEEVTAHNDEDKDTNVEIDSNELYLKIGKSELVERLISIGGKPAPHESISYKDLCVDLAYMVNEEVGHGSPITAGRAIDTLCSSKGDFEKYKEKGGKWRIRKKQT